MTRLKMKLKSQSKKYLKGKRRQAMLPKEEVNLPQNLKRKLEKNQHKQKLQKRKKNHRKAVVKQKVLRKRLIVNQRYQKWLQDPAFD